MINFKNPNISFYYPEQDNTNYKALIERAETMPSGFKLPSDLTKIGDNAFKGWTALNLTSLPSGITSIDKSAFTDCTNLALINLPSGITSIPDFCFSACIGLRTIKFLGDITTLKYSCFAYCTGITEYDFSNNTAVPTLTAVINLGHASGCVIKVPSSLLSTWQTATNWSSLTDVTWQGV